MTDSEEVGLEAAQWALESEPTNPSRWFEIGCKLLREASSSAVDLNPLDRTAACLALMAALELNPADAAMCGELGRLLDSCGAVDAAARAYVRAAELDPESPQTCERAAALFVKLGRIDAVERWATEGIGRARQAGASSSVRTALANSLLRAGHAVSAAGVLEEVAEEHPNDPQAIANLAVALRRAGDVERAVAVAKRVVELAPDAPDSYLVLGRSLEAAGQTAPARRAYEDAIAHGRTSIAAQEAAARLERLESGAPHMPDSGTISARADADGSFSGDLIVLAVPELLEVLRVHTATGELHLWSGDKSVQLDIHRGRIVRATGPDGTEVDAPPGLDAPEAATLIALIGEVVRWNEGHFEFVRTRGGLDVPGGLDAQFLLMEVMRTLDEATR